MCNSYFILFFFNQMNWNKDITSATISSASKILILYEEKLTNWQYIKDNMIFKKNRTSYPNLKKEIMRNKWGDHNVKILKCNGKLKWPSQIQSDSKKKENKLENFFFFYLFHLIWFYLRIYLYDEAFSCSLKKRFNEKLSVMSLYIKLGKEKETETSKYY